MSAACSAVPYSYTVHDKNLVADQGVHKEIGADIRHERDEVGARLSESVAN